jgi:hypothetical protein
MREPQGHRDDGAAATPRRPPSPCRSLFLRLRFALVVRQREAAQE